MTAAKTPLLALALLCACAVDQREVPLATGDLAAHRDHVHPLLEASCATLDCHGDFRRPLRIFSEIGLRRRTELRGTPITEEELESNVASLLGVDPSAVGEGRHLALLKPLAEGAGGVHHVGEDLWPDRQDAAYLCLAGWMRGDGAAAIAGDCAAGLAPVRLPDP